MNKKMNTINKYKINNKLKVLLIKTYLRNRNRYFINIKIKDYLDKII